MNGGEEKRGGYRDDGTFCQRKHRAGWVDGMPARRREVDWLKGTFVRRTPVRYLILKLIIRRAKEKLAEFSCCDGFFSRRWLFV